MPRRAGFVPLYSREPHRCAALDARWMCDLFQMRSGLKLTHGDTLLPFQAERGRFRFHQRATPCRRKEQGNIRLETHIVGSLQIQTARLVLAQRGCRIENHFVAVRMSAIGPKRTSLVAPHMSAFWGKADIRALRHSADASFNHLVRARPSIELARRGVSLFQRHKPHLV
jgi:hypothetical protein